jgi:hypothetical protein
VVSFHLREDQLDMYDHMGGIREIITSHGVVTKWGLKGQSKISGKELNLGFYATNQAFSFGTL